MYTKRKSKYFLLISIGLLILCLPNLIEHSGNWELTELTRGIFMGAGIGVEIVGLILIRKYRMQTKKH
ncbi:hypothetical protein [Brumimicrobium aurantiacum]|uniref:Uncharacterized protein n=1 Tax=Brumimicrobium aurantiacum TaxID=1737063 RepID=A0A3E1EXK0_9FLAO|nr:hypothetical protein [Brumimicrobium aurantiacum]RFC54272.1 hypothetical protein DXU93_09815 [Brumimicrobium aurantiacum]